jgi:putative ABC transport system ATP-binding protein
MLSLALSNIAICFPGLPAPVLAIDTLHIRAGERIAISGASGSGKSTFVNIVTGLERAKQGVIDWGGTDIARFSETARDRWRGQNVGLVMQEFHLLPGLSALDNILLPARLARALTPQCIERAGFLLNKTGLTRPQQRIDTMSRGEMQRVAIARALLRKPGVVIADEPTASLDPESGEAVGRLLVDLAQIEGSTLIIITHDRLLAERLPRRLELANGRIVSDAGGKS